MTKYLSSALALALICQVGCGDDNGKAGDAGDGGGSDAATDAGKDAGGGDEPDASSPADAGHDSGASDAGTTAMLVARGDYIVNHLAACGDCHTPRDAMGKPIAAKAFSGVDCFIDADPSKPDFGCLSSRNLTSDVTGLKNRSDQEIKDMFLHGMRPNGQALVAVMPYWVFGNMTDDDADSIVAYLRTLKPVKHMIKANQAPFMPPAKPAPTANLAVVPKPKANKPNYDSALRGRYIAASIGICMECHTARDSDGVPLLKKAFAGGEEFDRDGLHLPPIFPTEIYSSNLTQDATGILGWKAKDIVAALKKGVDKAGVALCPPMPGGPMQAFGGMTDGDALDVANYLLSLPAIANGVPMCTPGVTDDDAGVSQQ